MDNLSKSNLEKYFWQARTYDFKTRRLSILVTENVGTSRVKKILQNVFGLWGIGALCILIPLAHFVLVPTFLVLGIYFGFRALGYRYQIRSGSFACPNCENLISVQNSWFKDELRLRCESCGTQIVVEKIPTARPQ